MIEVVEYNTGAVHHLKEGWLHRPNGPAIVHGIAEHWGWYLEGYAHRYYGPCNNEGDWRIHDYLEIAG